MDATFPSLFLWHRRQSTDRLAERTDPPPRRVAQPVFIHDAITPWRGETLLSVRLREDLEAAIKKADSRRD